MQVLADSADAFWHFLKLFQKNTKKSKQERKEFMDNTATIEKTKEDSLMKRLWEWLTRFHNAVIEDIVRILHGDQAAQLAIEALKREASKNNLEAMNVLDSVITRVVGVDEDYEPGKGFSAEKAPDINAVVDEAFREYHEKLFRGIPLKECSALFEDGKLKDNIRIIDGEPDKNGFRQSFVAEVGEDGNYSGGAIYKICPGSAAIQNGQPPKTVRLVELQAQKGEDGNFVLKDKGGLCVYQGSLEQGHVTDINKKNPEKWLKYSVFMRSIAADMGASLRDEFFKAKFAIEANGAILVEQKLFDKYAGEIDGNYDGVTAKLERRENDMYCLELTADDGTTVVIEPQEDKYVAYLKGDDTNFNLVELTSENEHPLLVLSANPERHKKALEMLQSVAADKYMKAVVGLKNFSQHLRLNPTVLRNDDSKPFKFTDLGQSRFDALFSALKNHENANIESITTSDNGTISITAASGKKMTVDFNPDGHPYSLSVGDDTAHCVYTFAVKDLKLNIASLNRENGDVFLGIPDEFKTAISEMMNLDNQIRTQEDNKKTKKQQMER